MTTHRIEAWPGGTIVLPSGEWTWLPVPVYSMPDGGLTLLRIAFFHSAHRDESMALELPLDVREITPEDAARYAAAPEERKLVVGGEQVTIRRPFEQDPDQRLEFRVVGHTGVRRGHALSRGGRPLGHLTRDQLEALVREA